MRRLAAWLPALIVTAFGLYLLWPAPLGTMPLSADHTVHLTRAYLYGEQLAGGHLVGWSPTWFFGFPLGELYPVLGDLGVVLLRVLSLGLLDWSQAYALMFTLVFLTQGWALLRCGRALAWGPVPGLVAALLVLADVGAYREGGWTYTVLYGVWPQALSTALAWLAFAELALAARAEPVPSASRPSAPDSTSPPVPSAIQPVPPDTSPSSSPAAARPGPSAASPDDRPVRRHLVRAALAITGALLAHPMALMMLAIGAPLYLLTHALRGPADRRTRLATTTLHLGLALIIGAALAAWWWLPMSANRSWMANYGWLHAPLADMLRLASRGQWTQFMPAAVGHCASLGLLAAAVLGRAPLRFFALWTLAHWLLASTDLFWTLRLDWLSGGFQHIQYQRFLIAAKPGFFLLAGAAVGGLLHLALWTWSNRHVRSAIRRRLFDLAAALAAALALALAGWQLTDARALMPRGHVGDIQTERLPGTPGFAADYAAFLSWARGTWDARESDYRISFRADRNLHWFMDSPVHTHTPSYKQGFTPGDNFVHKPESGDPALLRRLGVRFVAGTGTMPPVGGTRVARFGQIHVFELADHEPLAHLAGSGQLAIENPSFTGEALRVRVTDVTDEQTRLVLHVAGYPRWQLTFTADGGSPEAIEWFEAPVLGDSPIATQQQRRAGELRGGKALGDDGHEPTLIATAARNGTYELHYRRWQTADILGLLATLAGLAGLLALARSRRLLPRLRPWARRVTHPLLLLALLVVGLALALARHHQGSVREHDLASAHLRRGAAETRTMVAGPLKTDMIVLPAALARPDRSGRSEATFKNVQLAATLSGWYAIDDDDAKLRRRGSHRLRIAARPHATASEWTPLADLAVRHRPDRRFLDEISVPPALQSIPIDVRVEVETTGEAPPKFGLDLTLPEATR